MHSQSGLEFEVVRAVDALSKGKYNSTTTGEFYMACPFHRDRHPSFYVGKDSGAYYCHSCKRTGSIFVLATKTVPGWKSKIGKLLPARPVQKVPNEVGLPEGVFPLFPYAVGKKIGFNEKAIKYLESRRITPEQVDVYRPYFCPYGKCAGRIIFPFYKGNIVEFWVGRSIHANAEPRYLCSTGPKGMHIFNFERALRYDTVILVEGIFDALAVGYNGIATLGKNPSKFQIARIAQAGFRKIYIALDSDTSPTERNSLASAFALFTEVGIINLPDGKDPSDLGPEFFKPYAPQEDF